MLITQSPFFTPAEMRKLTARLLARLMSPKVMIFSSPAALHQTSARFSGARRAYSSTTSKPKLKFSGTENFTFLTKSS